MAFGTRLITQKRFKALMVALAALIWAGLAPMSASLAAQDQAAQGLAILELHNENKDVRLVTKALRDLAGMETHPGSVSESLLSSGAAIRLKAVSAEDTSKYYVSRTDEGYLAVDRVTANANLKALAHVLAGRPDLDQVISRFLKRLSFAQRVAVRAKLLATSEEKLVRQDGFRYMKGLLRKVSRRHLKEPAQAKAVDTGRQ
ncbi:MAG: hypothetical protein AAGI06_13340 [Pseudomonadota bacterium]